MADIKKIDGYFIKDASARTEIGVLSGDLNKLAADVNKINNSVVKYNEAQSLNSTQKTQARTNIGAAADNHNHDSSYAAKSHDHNSTYVRFDTNAQGLNATQKTNARTNIGAGTSNLTIGTTSTTAAAGNHTHSYIPLSGSSAITGNLTPSTSNTRDLGSNSLYWNNAYIKTITSSNTVSATNGFIETSDINKKNIIGEIDLNKAYALIDKCSTIIYTLKDDPDQKEQIGTIAQEVQEFFPEIVETAEDGSLMLSYSRLTVILMKVMKDLINRVQKLENK